MPVKKVKGGYKCGNLSKKPVSKSKATKQCAAVHVNKRKS